MVVERHRAPSAAAPADDAAVPEQSGEQVVTTGEPSGQDAMTDLPAVESPAAEADTPPPTSRAVGTLEAQASRLPRFALIAITMGGIALALSMLHAGADIIVPVFFALNLMITVHPVYGWLTLKKFPAWGAAVLAGILVIVILFAFMIGIFWALAAMVQELSKYTEEFTSTYDSLVDFLTEQFGVDEEILMETLQGVDPQRLLSFAAGLLSNLTGVLSLVVVIVTSVIFMIMDTSGMAPRLVTAKSSHPRIVDGFMHFSSGVRRYWLVTTLFGVIVALLDWGVLLWVGVPLAGVWAVFSFLTNYIPNIGFIIGVIPPAILAFFDSGLQAALIVIVSYSVLNFIVQSIIQPKFTGDAVGITASMSFLSLLVWTAVLGPFGALLALPSTLLVKSLLIDTDPASRWVNTLISSRPETGDPAGATTPAP